MLKNIIGLLAGLLFGFGLLVSGMTDPEKVPLIPAIRPMPSSKITVATPSIRPPTKEIGVNACQSICILITDYPFRFIKHLLNFDLYKYIIL